MRLRLATYNVHGFRAGVDRVVRVVHELDADALLLQETGPRRALARFAESMGSWVFTLQVVLFLFRSLY